MSTTIKNEYDYIIAGGGTAGLVLAARLTEDPNNQVLVIEAGGDKTKDPVVQTPGLVAGLYGKKEYDWGFVSTPQASLHDRVISQSRGRMLGGSSGMSFFMMVFPARAILDTWEGLGNPGWNYDGLAPYFRKFSRTADPSQVAKESSRMAENYDESISKQESGPVGITYSEQYGVTNSAWMDTFAQFGLKSTTDPRSGKSFGAFQQSSAIDPKTKTRTSSATAYLSAEIRGRSNLDVLTNNVVKRILLEKGEGSNAEVTAKGVLAKSNDGHEQTIKVRREVLLAAGALQSPQILELSGIGDKALLEKHGIPVVIDNPNVGEHMQDHPIVCQTFEVNDGVPTSDVLRDPSVLQTALEQYKNGGKGPLGESLISIAHVPMADAHGMLPVEQRKTLLDTQLAASQRESELAAKAVTLVRKVLESEREPSLQYFAFPGQTTIKKIGAMAEILMPSRKENCITLMTMLNHPFSRGHVHIVSPDVDVKPIWDPCYNAESADLEILAGGAKFLETLVQTEPLKNIFREGGVRWPEIKADSDENAREIVRQAQISVFHVSGSCIMAPKELGGVVDSHLRVYGVKGLRVVDASVFPIEPLGNIQTTVYAVAEKAADIVKEDNKAQS